MNKKASLDVLCYPSRTMYCMGPSPHSNVCDCRSILATFTEHVSFKHSNIAGCRLIVTSRIEGNRQNSKVSSHTIVDQSVRLALPVFGRSAASAGSAATFLPTESTGTVLIPRQTSQIAGHE